MTAMFVTQREDEDIQIEELVDLESTICSGFGFCAQNGGLLVAIDHPNRAFLVVFFQPFLVMVIRRTFI